MGIYTKNGDSGFTTLANGKVVAKYDKTIELLGTIDEVNSMIGFAKVQAMSELKAELNEIQGDLMRIMAQIADPGNKDYLTSEKNVRKLESWIDRMENSFSRKKEFVHYGGCELSARLDMARSVARRAERLYSQHTQSYTADKYGKCYMNRISDYLYLCARLVDYQNN